MEPRYRVNDTSAYHAERLETLGWEMTVCNMLEPDLSPCRGILRRNTTYGNLLYDHLASCIPVDGIRSVMEIGGGYGCLMRDFLARNAGMNCTMLDLSPAMLTRQRETLRVHPVKFVEGDFFRTSRALLARHDLVVLNEVVGDFPTLCDIHPSVFSPAADAVDPIMSRARTLIDRYGLTIPDHVFNLNIGALEAVERLCRAGVAYVFLSEHSCEASVSEELRRYVHVAGTGNPERIRLKGHDEYTIRFSDVARVAEGCGYRTVRGRYRDFLSFDWTDRLTFIMTSRSQKDEHEVIRQFVEDCFTYEYLVMARG